VAPARVAQPAAAQDEAAGPGWMLRVLRISESRKGSVPVPPEACKAVQDGLIAQSIPCSSPAELASFLTSADPASGDVAQLITALTEPLGLPWGQKTALRGSLSRLLSPPRTPPKVAAAAEGAPRAPTLPGGRVLDLARNVLGPLAKLRSSKVAASAVAGELKADLSHATSPQPVAAFGPMTRAPCAAGQRTNACPSASVGAKAMVQVSPARERPERKDSGKDLRKDFSSRKDPDGKTKQAGKESGHHSDTPSGKDPNRPPHISPRGGVHLPSVRSEFRTRATVGRPAASGPARARP